MVEGGVVMEAAAVAAATGVDGEAVAVGDIRILMTTGQTTR